MKFAIGVLIMTMALDTVAATPKKPVTNVYHGVSVADDYQWLENFEDPAVRKWNDEQNAAARA